MSSTLQSIKYSRGRLEILDQTKLPLVTTYVHVVDVNVAWQCINGMKVRGAPAIAIVSCLSLAVELHATEYKDNEALNEDVQMKLNYLISARPTAVNARKARDDVFKFIKDNMHVDKLKDRVLEFIEMMLHKDVVDNKTIGQFGAECIILNCPDVSKVNVLTHCNTGSLATAGYGTALGVIRCLHSMDKLDHIYFTETRPFNQGARLTSYELLHEEIPSTMICDSAAAWLMKNKNIHAIVVGADHVTHNGDTANKIGTYSLAVLAKHHNIPFYVAAPRTSCTEEHETDLVMEVEHRHADEMTMCAGVQVAHPLTSCWNPGFDVTPPELITAIITEHGFYTPGKLPPL